MEQIERPYVSVIEPVSQAIEKTKEILLQPFDLKKWGVIGFCAWLAALGGNGGVGRIGKWGRFCTADQNRWPDASEIGTWPASNLFWVVPATAGVVIFIILFSIALAWLRSRGKFMFLHCVALNCAQVALPWNIYSQQSNSLFLFKLSTGLMALFCFLPFLAMAGVSYWMIGKVHILLLSSAIVLLLILCIGLGIIFKFTNDFVVPIMALRNCRVMKAWQEFYELMRNYKWNFFVYLLFQIAIVMALAVIGSLATLLTCCFCFTACIPFAGTYIAAVILLPLGVFARSYSLYYLAQYGEAYNVFAPAPAIPAPPETDSFSSGNGI